MEVILVVGKDKGIATEKVEVVHLVLEVMVLGVKVTVA